MSEKLIELINKGSVIVIRGQTGTGKSLLLSKIFNSPNFREEKKWCLNKSDIVDISNQKCFYFLDNGIWEELELVKELKMCFMKTHHKRHKFHKFFIVVDENEKREEFAFFHWIADLHIETCGVNSDLKNLALKVKRGIGEWKKSISITPNDISKLNEMNELKFMANQQNGNEH